jgi:23S rRNA (cytidine2498-2'-O)-methyltransferase
MVPAQGSVRRHLLVCDPGCETFLMAELARASRRSNADHCGLELISTDLALDPKTPPILVFARQLLIEPQQVTAPSIRAWAGVLLEVIRASVPEVAPWRLHIHPHYGSGNAGQNRARLIHDALRELLQRKRKVLLRDLDESTSPWTPQHTFVQLLLTAPDHGWISVAPAPQPYAFRRIVSPFPVGEVPIAVDKAAPSRAFSKLVEAEARLGRQIVAGETCLDLGASPGSWTYVALRRGANVLAVDRSPLRDDLMRHTRLTFQQGDAFKFRPATAVDWLLCDVIAAPQRSIDLLLEWVNARRAKHFVVTIKFKGHSEYPILDQIKGALPPVCSEFYLIRLCANKNETCAFGSLNS